MENILARAKFHNISSKLSSPNQLEILKKSVLHPNESPEEMIARVVYTISAHDDPTNTENYIKLLSNLDFLPSTPVLYGAGTSLNQLAACFVLPISDDLGKNSDSIFSTLKNAILIQQSGGGVGFDFSDLRPKGDMVKSIKGISSGPISFIKTYNKAIEEIAQGGRRRGAAMAILRVDHPDILEFINCKSVEGDISTFNLSVAITDSFMHSLTSKTDFNLINPRNGEITSSISPTFLLDKIITGMMKNGEPGIVFPEKANIYNPLNHIYQLKSTNPCGEQWLGPYENCCLGSINLANHIHKDVNTNIWKIDWNQLHNTTSLAVRFLDNVVSANKYVPEIPQLKDAALNSRRIGLGITGLADLLIRLDITYNSFLAFALADYLMANIKIWSLKTSIQLAKEKGPFPYFKNSLWDTNPSILVPYHLDDYLCGNEYPDLFGGNLTKNYYEIKRTEILADIQKFGLRNAALNCIAPTGTTSTIMGVQGYGCEPLIALSYKRNVVGKSDPLVYNCYLLEEALIEEEELLKLDESSSLSISKLDTLKFIREHVSKTGKITQLNYPSKWNRFICASDITPMYHLQMQECLQKWVDNSISKTINCSKDITKEQVIELIQYAYNSPYIKGFTIYVAGSREKEVLKLPENVNKMSRPHTLSGQTQAIETSFGTAFVTLNKTEKAQPFEMFINIGKGGTDLAAISEGYGRLISLILRLDSPIPPSERLELIYQQMKGIGGSSKKRSPGGHCVLSLPDAIAQAIHTDDHSTTSSSSSSTTSSSSSSTTSSSTSHSSSAMELCPSCQNLSLVFVERCKRCTNCNYTMCG
jgi:ribonucleoside-diphosphate reductase alpha chain